MVVKNSGKFNILFVNILVWGDKSIPRSGKTRFQDRNSVSSRDKSRLEPITRFVFIFARANLLAPIFSIQQSALDIHAYL